MTTGAAASHDYQIGVLLECGPEEGCDGIAVDNHASMCHRGLDERPAPTLLEQGDHVIPMSHRRHDQSVVEARQQPHGVDSNDFSDRVFDEGCCPFKGTFGVFRAIDADDDAARGAHGCLRIEVDGPSAFIEKIGCMTVTPP